MVQVLREPNRKDALLDLLFVIREGLVSKVEIGGHLGQSDRAVKFKVSADSKKKCQQNFNLGHEASRLQNPHGTSW